MADTDQMAPLPTAPRRRPDAWWLASATIVLVAIIIGKLLAPASPNRPATEHPGVGQPLPLLELQPLTGAADGLSLKDVRGKVTLVNYWGTWCPPCIMEFPHMIELWDKYRGNPGFQFLSVSSTFDLHENVSAVREETEKFLKLKGTTLPTYIDADGASRQILETLIGREQGFAYPTTVLLDRNAVIRAVWVGYFPGSEREMEQLVSKLLAEKDEQEKR